jgi:hypothetical protein
MFLKLWMDSHQERLWKRLQDVYYAMMPLAAKAVQRGQILQNLFVPFVLEM